ncbi:Hypothetical predicted protein, partial [Paramuricea clavata]
MRTMKCENVDGLKKRRRNEGVGKKGREERREWMKGRERGKSVGKKGDGECAIDKERKDVGKEGE